MAEPNDYLDISVDGFDAVGTASGEAFTKGKFYYQGYEDPDSMFNNLITANIDAYKYESTVKELRCPAFQQGFLYSLNNCSPCIGLNLRRHIFPFTTSSTCPLRLRAGDIVNSPSCRWAA